jgi:hypothetical protein
MFTIGRHRHTEEPGYVGGCGISAEPQEFRGFDRQCLRIRVGYTSAGRLRTTMQQRKPRHTEPLAPDLRAQLGALLGRTPARALSRQWGVSRGVLQRAVRGEGVTPMAGRYLTVRVLGASAQRAA